MCTPSRRTAAGGAAAPLAELRRRKYHLPATATLPVAIRLPSTNSAQQVLTIGAKTEPKFNGVELYVGGCWFMVSIQHAQIELRTDGVHYITDRQPSKNGLFVNGRRVSKKPAGRRLRHGDIIAFGPDRTVNVSITPLSRPPCG